jgi:hypothetical protein
MDVYMSQTFWKIGEWQQKNRAKIQERIKQMTDKLGDRMTVQMTEAHGVLQGTLMTEEGKQITLPKVKGRSFVQTPTEFAPGELKEEPEGEYPEVK